MLAEKKAEQELATSPELLTNEYQEFATQYLKMGPDNRFRHFGGTVSFDAILLPEWDIVLVPVCYEGDVEVEWLPTLGLFAVQAYLKQHLSHGQYFQMLMSLRDDFLHPIDGAFPEGQEENYDKFRSHMTSLDFTGIGIPNGNVFDAITGLTDGRYQSFLFDITSFWKHTPDSTNSE